MKSIKSFSTQWILTMLIALITVCGFSQRTITWKGGKPGMKSDWYCPQNWSTSSVPDEFSDAFIPDVSSSTFSAPCIEEGKIEINSLHLQSNASLTIGEDAMLVVISHIEGLSSDSLKGEGQLIRKEDLPSVMVSMVTLRLQ